MDIEKLIEQLKKSADFEDYPVVASFAAIIEKKYLREAATALSTLQVENEKLRAELEQVEAERDAAQSLLAERIGVRGAEPITMAFGLPLDRLRELAQADREGRCVVLPCKIGDIVHEIRYTAENDRPRKHARKRFDHSVSGCTWRMREQPEMCYVSEKKCTKSDFEFMGRTVFLTREEAEDALRREQE